MTKSKFTLWIHGENDRADIEALARLTGSPAPMPRPDLEAWQAELEERQADLEDREAAALS